MEFKVTWLDPDTGERLSLVLIAKTPDHAIEQVKTNLRRGGLKGTAFRARRYAGKS